VRYNLVIDKDLVDDRIAASREVTDRITVEEYPEGFDPMEIAVLHKQMQILQYLEERRETILDYRTLMGIR
jgi:hypothetical protein